MYLPNSAGWRAVLATPSLLGLARNLAASCTLAFGHSAAGTTRAFSAAGAADAMPPVAAAAAAVPTRVPVERLMRAINPDVCQELRDHGFAVIDNVFGAGTAAALRAEVHALKQQGHMHKVLLRGRGRAIRPALGRCSRLSCSRYAALPPRWPAELHAPGARGQHGPAGEGAHPRGGADAAGHAGRMGAPAGPWAPL